MLMSGSRWKAGYRGWGWGEEVPADAGLWYASIETAFYNIEKRGVKSNA